jgi:hypothetical protein
VRPLLLATALLLSPAANACDLNAYAESSTAGRTILIQGRAAAPRLGSIHPTESGSECGFWEKDHGVTAVDIWTRCDGPPTTSFLLQKKFPVGSPLAKTSEEYFARYGTTKEYFARYYHTDQGDWWVVDEKENKSAARHKTLGNVIVCESDKLTVYTYREIRVIGSNEIYTLRSSDVRTAAAGMVGKPASTRR